MPDMSSDWNKVRFDLDKSANFPAICNSPWYTDAVYEKFSDVEFARRPGPLVDDGLAFSSPGDDRNSSGS